MMLTTKKNLLFICTTTLFVIALCSLLQQESSIYYYNDDLLPSNNYKYVHNNRRRLMRYKPVYYKWDATPPELEEERDVPLQICGRLIPYQTNNTNFEEQYSTCPSSDKQPPSETTVLLLEGLETYGRTGNNLAELLHVMQYVKDHNDIIEDMKGSKHLILGIMLGSWATQLITKFWFAVQDEDIHAWIKLIEESLCVKIFTKEDELYQYKEIQRPATADLFFMYGQRRRKSMTPQVVPTLPEYIDYQTRILRTLWRSYNTGVGLNMQHKPVHDMCSVLNAMFQNQHLVQKIKTKRRKTLQYKISSQPVNTTNAVYSVIHSRSLESAGERLMEGVAKHTGCHPTAALNMEPQYIKSILEPLDMLDKPIIFITDNQRPEILDRLLDDIEIGPNINKVPDDESWIGGDITTAVLADVFIGTPASSFSIFIAKSRYALGYENSYLFRNVNEEGVWYDTLEMRDVFDHHLLGDHA